MSVVKEIIRSEADGSLSFGNFELAEKSKVADFAHGGDTYKVKTFSEITKLEKDEVFCYESVPGTSVFNFVENDDEVSFTVDCVADAQITLGLEENTIYRLFIDDEGMGTIDTGISGKLSFNINDNPGGSVEVRVVRV